MGFLCAEALPTSSPLSIGWPSPSDSVSSSGSARSSTSTSSFPSSSSSSSPAHNSCAYPSWPARSSLYQPTSSSYNNNTTSQSWFGYSNAPSSYISDADLYPDELLDEAPLMLEAPAAPRVLAWPVPVAASPAPLAPLYAPEKKKKQQQQQRCKTVRKTRPVIKTMTPIAESPLTQRS